MLQSYTGRKLVGLIKAIILLEQADIGKSNHLLRNQTGKVLGSAANREGQRYPFNQTTHRKSHQMLRIQGGGRYYIRFSTSN